MHVYPTTHDAYAAIERTYAAGCVEQMAIAHARLGKWDRSSAAAASAGGLVSRSLRDNVAATYREEQEATQGGWNLADTIVDIMNRRVTGQSPEQQAVTTAFIRRLVVDRYQVAADVERIRVRIAELGRRGLGVCNSCETAAARTAAVMSAPATSEVGTTLTATGYASGALPSSSPSRSAAQAVAWDATSAMRAHALTTIIKARRGRGRRRGRTTLLTSDSTDVPGTPAAAPNDQGSRTAVIPEATAATVQPPRAADSQSQQEDEAISDTELYRWLAEISSLSLSARAETAGMTLDATGESILRDGVIKYKREMAPGGSAQAAYGAQEMMQYMLARLPRHLVRPPTHPPARRPADAPRPSAAATTAQPTEVFPRGRAGPFTSPTQRATAQPDEGDRKMSVEEHAAYRAALAQNGAGLTQPTLITRAAQLAAYEETMGTAVDQSITHGRGLEDNHVFVQLEGSNELWAADLGYRTNGYRLDAGDTDAPAAPDPEDHAVHPAMVRTWGEEETRGADTQPDGTSGLVADLGYPTDEHHFDAAATHASPATNADERLQNERTASVIRKADRKPARNARAAERGDYKPDGMPGLISASTTDYSSSDAGTDRRMPGCGCLD